MKVARALAAVGGMHGVWFAEIESGKRFPVSGSVRRSKMATSGFGFMASRNEYIVRY